jgi:hypothetical protein
LIPTAFIARGETGDGGPMGLWIENRWMALGYRNTECYSCRSRIWKLAFVLGFVDNTNNGFCPNCSNYIEL